MRCGGACISAAGATALLATSLSVGAAPTLAVACVFYEDAPLCEFGSQIVGGRPLSRCAGRLSIVQELLQLGLETLVGSRGNAEDSVQVT